MRVKKVGKTIETNYAGFFVELLIVTAGIDDSFKLTRSNSGKIK
jgi:hypothetical protein